MQLSVEYLFLLTLCIFFSGMMAMKYWMRLMFRSIVHTLITHEEKAYRFSIRAIENPERVRAIVYTEPGIEMTDELIELVTDSIRRWLYEPSPDESSLLLLGGVVKVELYQFPDELGNGAKVEFADDTDYYYGNSPSRN